MTAGEELVAVYDRDGSVVGSAPRARMRSEGLWHAATSVLVRSTDLTKVYVHRRTADKDVYPAMYDCWAGGVVAAGEAPDEAARRELAEELGIRAEPRFLFRTTHERGPVRFHAFVYEIRWDGRVIHQPEEIAAGWWMPLAELREHARDPDWPFVPDGRQFLTEWFDFREG
ncbi:NUDIX hydrolase [Actinopolyspora sp. H202]|uniref:NUDIX hydrolase n=1 Tax=Actinopolyspora sp. H202 TaxID=1500456 RepID=UPI003EE423AF